MNKQRQRKTEKNPRELLYSLFMTFLKNENYYIELVKVKEVDTTNLVCVCEQLDGNPDLLDVQLTALNGVNEAFYIIPKVGSFVFVAFKSITESFILSVQEAEKIVMNCDNIVFNRGANNELINIDQITNKLNELRSEVNQMVQVFNLHTHPGVQPGGGTTQVSATQQQNVTAFNKNDYKDVKITH